MRHYKNARQRCFTSIKRYKTALTKRPSDPSKHAEIMQGHLSCIEEHWKSMQHAVQKAGPPIAPASNLPKSRSSAQHMSALVSRPPPRKSGRPSEPQYGNMSVD